MNDTPGKSPDTANTAAAPPRARRVAVVHELHGRRREDPYAWLRDDDWQRVMLEPERLRADIRAHLEAENAWTAAVMAHTDALQTALVAEFRARIREDDSSVPDADGPWQYYQRYREGGQHPLICRRPRDSEQGEEVLLDGDAEAEGQAYYDIGECGHGFGHGLFAWTVDTSGSESYRLRVKDLRSGALLEDVIEHCAGDFEFSADDRYLFYTALDERHHPRRVCRHRLGTPASEDVVVYEEPDAGFFVGIGLTESRRFLVIDAHDHLSSETRLLPSAEPLATPMLVARRETEIEYDVSHHGERLLILTNADGAEDYKLVETPLASPAREHWRDLLAHRPGVLIVGFEVRAEWLVRLERENALPRIVVRHLASGEEHAIVFDEQVYSLGLNGGYEFDSHNLRFSYSSMSTPAQIFDYDMQTRERRLRKVQEVPSGHDACDYVTRRVMATAADGEAVPVSVLHRRDTPLDGSAPLLLYGYGAYGHSLPASFDTLRLSLVDRGFVYAIAHVRGGMERGYRWYREGRGLRKPNTFGDFIAVARCLVEAGFTRAGEIAIEGGSAGGLLVGAVLNQCPSLFKAALAEVPFVDVLNTMCDDSLPLTPPEWPEWGNPLESVEAYDCIAGYSPCENVRAEAYPHILALAGLSDPRVTYWEPAKWVARLRAAKTDSNRLLLHTNMEAGHGGAAGRFDALAETALLYAFVLDVFGRGTLVPARADKRLA